MEVVFSSVTQPDHKRGSGGEPSAARRFLENLWKKSYFNAIGSHFTRFGVQSHLKKLDF